jgi:transposase
MNNFLSEEEIKNLRVLHKKERDCKKCDRIKAIVLSDEVWPITLIAEALLLDEGTIRNHIKDYKSSKKLNIESGGSEENLTSSQAGELRHHLEENTYTKAELICIHVREKYGVSYTVSGMTTWLKKHGFTYKKPKGTLAKADPEKQAEFKKYYEALKNNTPDNEPIFFADVCHPTMATKISSGWIKKGHDKLIPTTAAIPAKNFS